MSAPLFKTPVAQTAFYFANRNNDKRTTTTYYGPFATREEALFFADFHYCMSGVSPLVFKLDELQVIKMDAKGIIFNHFERAGYFMENENEKEVFLKVKVIKNAWKTGLMILEV
jgi:hypothetical protein